MLEIILLIFGVVKALRRFALSALTVQDFPDVAADDFTEWQQAQLKATDILLWATWGAFFIKLVLVRTIQPSSFVAVFAILAGWVVGLVLAVVQSNKASSLRDATGIDWPKRDAYVALLRKATVRLQELHDAGLLPGIGRDESCDFDRDPHPHGETVAYPVSIVFHVTKQQDGTRYSCTLTRESDASPWELTSARQTHASERGEDVNNPRIRSTPPVSDVEDPSGARLRKWMGR